VAIILMAIGGYFINGHWWLLLAIILMALGGYYINGYWWIFIKGLGFRVGFKV
jgi:hypothetical protein